MAKIKTLPNQKYTVINEEQYGRGENLAFPSMSSCAAIICDLGDELVGVHKTIGWLSVHTKVFQLALNACNGKVPRALYITGWDVSDPEKHSVDKIRTALNCNGVATYVFDYHNAMMTIECKGSDGGIVQKEKDAFKPAMFSKKMSDLCTFALTNPLVAPSIGAKQSKKVKVNAEDLSHQVFTQRKATHGANHMNVAVEQRVDSGSGTLHEIRFTEYRPLNSGSYKFSA